MDHVDRVALDEFLGFVAPLDLVATSQDIDLVGEVEHDHRHVGRRLAGAHHVHRFVDEHVGITVEAVVQPLSGPRQRWLGALVGKAHPEDDPVGNDIRGVTAEVEPAVVVLFDLVDVIADHIAAVALDLFGRRLEELVARHILCDPDHIVGVEHHRRAAATAVDDDRFVTQSRRVEGRRKTGRPAADYCHFIPLWVGFGCRLTVCLTHVLGVGDPDI